MLCSLGSGVNRETSGPGRASHLQQKQALNDSGVSASILSAAAQLANNIPHK